MVSLEVPFRNIPRVKLLFDHPTPVERLQRLTGAVGCGATLWIKRDDCNSGLAFGGNKIRKLEYVLADAVAKGSDTLVTTGGVQSNHMRQTAAAAARLGLKVALYPRDLVKAPSPEYHYAGNVQINSILNAETFPLGTNESEVIRRLESRGRKPYSIPPGASMHPLGGLGYARWAFELLQQERTLGETFDTIVVATGSGSTIGGMLAGFKFAQELGLDPKRRRLIGINILGRPPQEITDLVIQIATNTAQRIGLDRPLISADDFELYHEFIGAGYGQLNEETRESIQLMARLEGILTDPVYTGKALTGMLHIARKGGFPEGNVLFCHTGGQAAMSAYVEMK